MLRPSQGFGEQSSCCEAAVIQCQRRGPQGHWSPPPPTSQLDSFIFPNFSLSGVQTPFWLDPLPASSQRALLQIPCPGVPNQRTVLILTIKKKPTRILVIYVLSIAVKILKLSISKQKAKRKLAPFKSKNGFFFHLCYVIPCLNESSILTFVSPLSVLTASKRKPRTYCPDETTEIQELSGILMVF